MKNKKNSYLDFQKYMTLDDPNSLEESDNKVLNY